MKEQSQPAYYSIIPANVRYNPKLTANAKLLYSEITALCNQKGFCWATNRHFAELYDVSSDRVGRWVASLIKEGFISSEHAGCATGTLRKLKLTHTVKITSPYGKNNVHNNKRNIKDSKESCAVSPDTGRTFGGRCIKVWNNFQFTRTHSSIAIRKQVDRYMEELMDGTFIKTRSISNHFFKAHNISLNGKKYTKSELLQGIKNIALIKKEGYVSNPKNVPSDLPSLIYNPRTSTSLFLRYLKTPPVPLMRERPVKDTHESLTKLFIPIFPSVPTPKDRGRLIQGIKSLVEFQKRIPENSLKGSISRQFGDKRKLCKSYLEWLKGERWVEDDMKIGFIKESSKMFQKFITEKEHEFGGYKLK